MGLRPQTPEALPRTPRRIVDPIVDLAPGAEENALAVRLAETIRRNLRESPRKMGDFRAVRASVILVAQDVGDALTLRFDHGRLTIHDGAIGIPSVTFCGDRDVLARLSEVPITPWMRLPLAGPGDPAGREALRDFAGRLAHGSLKVYGILAHPRLVLRFLRMVSVRG